MKKPRFRKVIIDVQVHDLARAVDFYKEILRLPLIRRASDWASFEAVGAEIHLYLHGGTTYGMEFRVSDLEREVEILKEKGVNFFTDSSQADLVRITGDIMEFPWGKASYFQDSEGNSLALVEDEKSLWAVNKPKKACPAVSA